jgi:hypothetical protein
MPVARLHPVASPTTSSWTSVDAAARRQHGVVSLGQLLATGLSESAVRRAVQAGRLQRLHRGVYRLPGTARSSLQTWQPECWPPLPTRRRLIVPRASCGT